MISSFAAIGDVAIGALPDEQPSGFVPLRQRLLRGDEVDTVMLVEITSRPVAPVATLPDVAEAIGERAIGDAGDLLAGASPDERLFVSDGVWCGRPDDVGAAHLEANVRVLDVGEWQEEIPFLPEQDRRASTTTAVLRLANADGALDGFFGQRTVDGQRVRAWLTDDNDGYSSDWVAMFDSLIEALDPELDEARLTPLNVAELLAVPALRGKYAGVGGSSGDARLAGKFVPLAFGACFNVEPDNESFADGIDRWSESDLIDITVVKDGGAPLLWDGNDWPDYSSLKNAAVAPGFFTKALAIGRSKRGAEAIFPVTGDIIAPYDTTAEILLALASGAGGLPDELINRPSFGALPTAKVDLYLKGDRQVSVAEIFDALLRPFNAWYGSSFGRALEVGLIGTPTAAPELWAVESHEIFEESLRVRKFEQPPRWRVGVTGVRNWRPMTTDELVDFTENPSLPQAMWQRLQREEETAERSDSSLLQRHAGAIDSIESFGATRGYFTNLADAQAAADGLFAFLSRPMRRVECSTGLQEVFTRAGQTGRITVEGRLDMENGRPALVTRRIFRSSREIGLSTLVVVDAAA